MNFLGQRAKAAGAAPQPNRQAASSFVTSVTVDAANSHPSSSSCSSSTTTPSQPEGPDYTSVFKDPMKEAAYRAKEFKDWNRKKTGPRGAEAFLQMILTKFPKQAALYKDNDIHNMNVNDLSDLMVLFAQLNDVDSLKWCLELGADPGFINDRGVNALTIASFKGSNQVLEYLLLEVELNPSKKDRNGFTALLQAGGGGHESTIHLLVNYGSWLTEVSNKRRNILHLLLMKYHVDVAKAVLLQYSQMKEPSRNQVFDFQQIDDSNKNILSAAFKCLILVQSASITKETSIEEIRQIIAPRVELCRLIRRITNLPYTEETHYQGHRSYTPIKQYVDDNEESCSAYIGDLFKGAPDFLKEIVNSTPGKVEHEDLIRFKRFYAEHERETATVFVKGLV